MNRLSALLATALSSFVLLAASGVQAQTASKKPDASSAQLTTEKKTKRVWTNEDVEGLRDKLGVSMLGVAPNVEPEKKKPAADAAPYVKEKDPAWYREQLGPLRAELDEIDSEIRELSEYRSITRYMVAGIIVPQLAGLPLNPEGQIKQLKVQRRQVVQKIDALEELARHNNILPGEIR